MLALYFLVDCEAASSPLHFDLFDPLLDGEAMKEKSTPRSGILNSGINTICK